jgi:hypothetical protein
MIRFCLLNICLFFTLSIYSQNVSVKAYLDSNNIKIGNQVTLSLEVVKPRSTNVVFPVISDTIIKQIEIIKRLPLDTIINKDSSLKIRQKYVISSFDSGLYTIPSFNFLLKKDSLTDTLRTDPLILTVLTIPVDTVKQQIRDIKDPFKVSLTFMEILTWILYGLGAVIIILIAIYVYRKYRKNEPIIRLPEKPKEPAHLIALRELDKLKDEKLWQNDLVKKYHSELTEIVRRYIENRFNIMALEQTSYEILQSINNSGNISNPSIEALRHLLTIADFVKFAKVIPLPDENDSSLRNAYLFVNETKDEPNPIIGATVEIESKIIKNNKELNE